MAVNTILPLLVEIPRPLVNTKPAEFSTVTLPELFRVPIVKGTLFLILKLPTVAVVLSVGMVFDALDIVISPGPARVIP